jgi:hypothetical protein
LSSGVIMWPNVPANLRAEKTRAKLMTLTGPGILFQFI